MNINDPQIFCSKLLSISIAHLLHHSGIDRVHGSAHAVLVDILKEYLILLATKAAKSANACNRTQVSIFDLNLLGQHRNDALLKYLVALQTSKSKAVSHGGFPRISPPAVVIDLDELNVLMEDEKNDLKSSKLANPVLSPNVPGDQNENMEIDPDESFVINQENNAEMNVDMKATIIDVDLNADSNVDMNGDLKAYEKEQPHMTKIFMQNGNEERNNFPPIPSLNDQENFAEQLSHQVPSWESAIDLDDEDKNDDPYYRTETLHELTGMMALTLNQTPKTTTTSDNVDRDQDTIMLDTVPDTSIIESFEGNQDIAISGTIDSETRKGISMDDLLIDAMQAHLETKSDRKKFPLISHQELLTLITFRSHYGMAIPDGNGGGTSGFETKSLISDLFLLRMPALWYLYGGVQDLEPGGILASELFKMKTTRKIEKKRDSGQGKAPVRTRAEKDANKAKREAASAAKRQSLAEAAVRREVRQLAKLEKAESKGIRLDESSLALKEQLKRRVGGIVIKRKETKRDLKRREKEEMEALNGGSIPHNPKESSAGAPKPAAPKPVRIRKASLKKTIDKESSEEEISIMSLDEDEKSVGEDINADKSSPFRKTEITPRQKPIQETPKPQPSASQTPKPQPGASQTPKPHPSASQTPKTMAEPPRNNPIKLKFSMSSMTKPTPSKIPNSVFAESPLSKPPSPATAGKDTVYCICLNPTTDFGLFMVGCDKCTHWFHGSCVGVSDGFAGDYICVRCLSK